MPELVTQAELRNIIIKTCSFYDENKHKIILINTNRENAVSDCIRVVQEQNDHYCIVALNVLINEERTDFYLFAGTKEELLNKTFQNAYDPFVKNFLVLKYLSAMWAQSPQYCPIYFYLTVKSLLIQEIHISDVAVATIYQKKGIMKKLLLSLFTTMIKKDHESYNVRAIALHPATYKFFNPWDKDCQHFDMESIEERNLGDLLSVHMKPQ